MVDLPSPGSVETNNAELTWTSVDGGNSLTPDPNERFGAAGHLQLVEDAGHVVLHRLLGEVHLIADLFVGLALGDESEDAFLLRRKPR